MIKQTIFLLASAASIVVAHHVRDLPHRAVAKLTGENVNGNITFTELEDGKVRVQGAIVGMPQGFYGFHVHEKGDITGACETVGPHFNPEHQDHGHPKSDVRHVGDLGNIEFKEAGRSEFDFVDDQLALHGPHNIIGRSVVLHEQQDDYGKTSHPNSRTTGNAGRKVACGVIGILDPVYNYTYTWSNSTAGSSSSSVTVSLLLMSPIMYLTHLLLH